jgi:hypothetical protein
MKKRIGTFGVVLSIVLVGQAFAEGNKEVVHPDSNLYTTSRLMEQSEYKFTTDFVEKAMLQQQYTYERITESEIAMGNGEFETAIKLIEEASEGVGEVQSNLSKAVENGQTLSTAYEAIVLELNNTNEKLANLYYTLELPSEVNEAMLDTLGDFNSLLNEISQNATTENNVDDSSEVEESNQGDSENTDQETEQNSDTGTTEDEDNDQEANDDQNEENNEDSADEESGDEEKSDDSDEDEQGENDSTDEDAGNQDGEDDTDKDADDPGEEEATDEEENQDEEESGEDEGNQDEGNGTDEEDEDQEDNNDTDDGDQGGETGSDDGENDSEQDGNTP